MNRQHGFLIAAPQSGSGKTTVSLAIMAALSRRGLRVAPFKCGPDFIDPGYHRLVTGHPSINLDGWMCPEEFVCDTFCHHTTAADIAVIEGVMGLFDGMGSEAMAGSSAQIAALTGAPVVLVVNARGMAASAAALVKGFADFQPSVRVAGVIFNNVGSTSHAALLREAVERHCPDIVWCGWLPRDEQVAIPERHLGLVTAEDNPLPADFIDHLAELAERHLELDVLAGLKISGADRFGIIGREQETDAAAIVQDTSRTAVTGARNERPSMPTPRIAVARDAAFCFCYEDNLRLLRDAGAELCFFSPLVDCAVPADCSGLYLPGGYPELYATRLSANRAMLDAIRTAVAANMPVYGECGGFVYLTEGLEAAEGQEQSDFAGIFPVRCRMLPRRKALGYRQVELAGDCIIGAAGTSARGHEFHYSEAAAMPENVQRRYRVSRRGVYMGDEGFQRHNCLASYIHLHFGSNPALAPAFVAACQHYKTTATRYP